jgi:hypothetical protein
MSFSSPLWLNIVSLSRYVMLSVHSFFLFKFGLLEPASFEIPARLF